MIGIPFAAVNGGMATPAGSSFNVLAMGVFESIAGKPLTFLQWMAVGLPTAIVATLVCWICLVKIFKPEAINEECSASIREEAENAGKISAYEKKVLFMLGCHAGPVDPRNMVPGAGCYGRFHNRLCGDVHARHKHTDMEAV